jgi:hypothetical protein
MFNRKQLIIVFLIGLCAGFGGGGIAVLTIRHNQGVESSPDVASIYCPSITFFTSLIVSSPFSLSSGMTYSILS